MLTQSKSLRIASGYVSLQTISKYSSLMLDRAKDSGNVQLLVGMAFYEGMSSKQLDACLRFHNDLSIYENSGVYIAYRRKYHGKIYDFTQHNGNNRIFLGSSNFSPSGLYGNIECTLEVIEECQKQEVSNFLDILFSDQYAMIINKVSINTDSKIAVKPTQQDKYKALKKHNLHINKNLPCVSMDLSRIVDKQNSNLNVYFGKGRLNRKSEFITPRPWYEIEIISSLEFMRSNSDYPKGDFDAYTDDGLIMPMKTQGDNFKNLRSKNSLQIFGMWLKGKLEKSGCLKKYETITDDTLVEYGNSYLKLYKISDGKYFMCF